MLVALIGRIPVSSAYRCDTHLAALARCPFGNRGDQVHGLCRKERARGDHVSVEVRMAASSRGK